MSDLIIRGRVIDAPIETILHTIQAELSNGKLKDIVEKDDNFVVTCPHHKDGHEQHPSCSIYCGSGDVEYGWMHCFTCGESGPLYHFVGQCFDADDEYGKDWLTLHFGSTILQDKPIVLDDIVLEEDKPAYMDEQVLDNMESYHPYLAERNLSEETCKKFKIKYNPVEDTIVFPIRDIKGHLVALTQRKVKQKQFINDHYMSKANIFLLSDLLKEGYNHAVVVESQTDALSAWQYGYPAIALMGSGTTQEQIDVLNNTPIRFYTLMYDNDDAGRKGAERFKKMIRNDVLVEDVIPPKGKDINSMTKEEVDLLLKVD